MPVSITHTDDGITISAPYDKEFIYEVKKIGGRWNPKEKTWEVKDRHEMQLRALAVEYFGTDGSDIEGQPTVTLRIDADPYFSKQEIRLAGHTIVRKRSRDSFPVLGENVEIIKGDFPCKGGSAAYPRLEGEGVVLAWHEVPESIAASVMHEDGVAILPEGEVNAIRRREELLAQREELKARLELIEKELESLA